MPTDDDQLSLWKRIIVPSLPKIYSFGTKEYTLMVPISCILIAWLLLFWLSQNFNHRGSSQNTPKSSRRNRVQ